MSLWVTGDIHGSMEISKISNWNKKYKPNTKDCLIVCGDFGLIFNNKMTNEEKYWLNWLSDKKFTTIFLDGNHDNLNKILEYPSDIVDNETLFGKFRKINDKVLYSHRGNIFLYDNMSCLTIGGAKSIDKCMRKENIDWWSTELLSLKDEEYIFEKIKKQNKVKYVFTHASPESVLSYVTHDFGLYDKFYDPTTKVLQNVRERLYYDKWFCGHYHIDKDLGNFRFIYNDFIKI
ncbi:MAG: metallophosphoesterase [Novosphingobium sp.]|nr:metallophosphoesterase [Novosphingobium sp.]